jgi:hypothetical protein
MTIERFRGDTVPFVVNLTLKSSGLPADTTGCTYLMTVDKNKDPITPATRQFQLTGVIIGSPLLGVVSFSPSAANVDIVGDYFYDVQQTDASGKVRTCTKAKIKFIQDLSF